MAVAFLAAFGGNMLSQTTPYATDVTVTGNINVGDNLIADYQYNDDDGDPESGSTYQWYRADDISGTNEAAIDGAVALTYTLASADQSKYIRFGVVPDDGKDGPGTETFSEYTGPVNAPPVVGDIPDQEISEGGSFATISLDAYVADLETADAAILWSYSGNTDLSVSIVDRVATITPPDENWNGSETITFTAQDEGGLQAGDAATFTVTPENDDPVVENPLPDISLNEYFYSHTIDLTGVFSDPDVGDELLLSAYSVDEAVVTANVSGNNLVLSEKGHGTTSIVVTADDGEASVNDIFDISVDEVLPPGWDINPPDYIYSGQVTAKVYIDDLPVDAGYLGAFVNEECRGIVQARYFSPADYYVFELLFFSNVESGEQVRFRYFDPSEDKTYSLDVTMEFVSDTIAGNALNPVIMNNCTNFSLSFTPGWSWFSLNTVLDDMSVGHILSSCVSNGDFIKNQVGSATYYAAYDLWFGSLTVLNPSELYKVKLQNPCGIDYCGAPVDVTATSIDLVTGWNWVSYLPLDSLPINTALSLYTPTALDFIKNQIESATYYTSFGWFGTLTEMAPGEGYMMKVSNPGVLEYPQVSGKKSTVISMVKPRTTIIDPSLFEYNGNITTRILVDGKPGGSETDLLLAYVDDHLRGVSGGLCFYPLDGYFYPIMIYSNIQEGETVRFEYYDSRSGVVYSCQETIVFHNDMIVGNVFQPFDLNVSTVRPPDDFSENRGFRVYPNPIKMNDILNIEYQIAKPGYVRIEVIDMYGRQVDILLDQILPASSYSLQWMPDLEKGGVYFIRMESVEGRKIRKVTLIR